MEEVDSVRRVVDAMCAGLGRKVALVANYDGFRIDKALSDAYFAMVEKMHARHYSQATHYVRPVHSCGRSWAGPCRDGRRLCWSSFFGHRDRLFDCRLLLEDIGARGGGVS